MAADSSEPQLLGPLAVLVTELRRREGDLDAARAAVDEGLDRIAATHRRRDPRGGRCPPRA